jgi:hypothetical protein
MKYEKKNQILINFPPFLIDYYHFLFQDIHALNIGYVSRFVSIQNAWNRTFHFE